VAIVHASTAPLLDFWRTFPYSLKGDDAREFARLAIEYVRDHAVRHVVLAAAWKAYASDPTSTSRDSFGAFSLQLKQSVDAIQAAGADVWLVKDVPTLGFDVPRALSRACLSKNSVATLRRVA